jgi:hypothetical protein
MCGVLLMATVKQIPILFNDEMVRAILAGRKTQTRRILKPQPVGGALWTQFAKGYVNGNGDNLICRYGQAGDLLSVDGVDGALEITDVRLKKIRDITLGEICKEGLAGSIYEFTPVQAGFKFFAGFWDEIYGSGSWSANPWVWVIEFKRVDNGVVS